MQRRLQASICQVTAVRPWKVSHKLHDACNKLFHSSVVMLTSNWSRRYMEAHTVHMVENYVGIIFKLAWQDA